MKLTPEQATKVNAFVLVVKSLVKKSLLLLNEKENGTANRTNQANP